MKSILALLALLAALTAIPAWSMEVLSIDKCLDKECRDAFGHTPMAYCETELSKTALGEIETRHESLYAKYEKIASGEWTFEFRTNSERSSLKLAATEFDEPTGVLNFIFRDTAIKGICRRFRGQLLPPVRVERRPYLPPPSLRPPGYRLPVSWGPWQLFRW